MPRCTSPIEPMSNPIRELQAKDAPRLDTPGCTSPMQTTPQAPAAGDAVDRLSPILAHFAPKAALYFHGANCQGDTYPASTTQSYLHLVEHAVGAVIVDGQAYPLTEPCLIYLPRGHAHSFRDPQGLQMYCATIEAGQIAGNPLLAALPPVTLIPLSACSALRELICMIWRENAIRYCGYEVALNRLTEYLLVLLLRHIMAEQPPESGLLAGLADKKLAPVFNALHHQPAMLWDLDRMAHEAAMSRARFAEHFRTVVGMTPGDYLTQWRLTLARKQLLAGDSLKQVAPAVGYQSLPAFHRVFRARFGVSPKEWLATVQQSSSGESAFGGAPGQPL